MYGGQCIRALTINEGTNFKIQRRHERSGRRASRVEVKTVIVVQIENIRSSQTDKLSPTINKRINGNEKKFGTSIRK